MRLRTKSEQRAYLDGYEMCAKCIEKYLSNKGKQKLECLLMAVRNALEIEDIEPQESEDCRDCKKWEDCPCGKEGHENGTSIGYSIGECKDFEPQESEGVRNDK